MIIDYPKHLGCGLVRSARPTHKTWLIENIGDSSFDQRFLLRVSSLRGRGYLSIPSVTAANKSQTHPMPSSSEGGARRAWAAGLSVSVWLFPVLVAVSRTKEAAEPFWPSESEMIKNHATHYCSSPLDSTDLSSHVGDCIFRKGWAIVTHCECIQILCCNDVSPPEIQCDQMFGMHGFFQG